MSNTRWLRTGVAIALCGVTLVGCGGSSPPAGPAGLNPANRVPAKSIFYVELGVRPQGTLKQNLVQTIDAIGGPSAAAEVANKLTSAFGSKAQNIWSQTEPWLGRRVGLALIGLPPEQLTAQSLLNYLVLVIPTNDPSAASSYLSSKLPHPTVVTYEVVGDYALIGGPYAVQIASAVTKQASLARSSTYRRLTSRVDRGAFALFYERPYGLLQFETKLASEQASVPGSAGTVTSSNLALMKQSLSKVSAKTSAILTLNATPHTLRLEYSTFDGPPPGASTQSTTPSVAQLPASSWLALVIGGSFTQGSTISNLESAFHELSTEQTARLGTDDSSLRFFTNDLLPALGPLSLSISGKTKASVKGGISLTPASQSAGDRLLSAVQRMIGKRAVRLKLGHDGDQLVATYGYKSFGEMLTPRSTLSSNPAFKQALALLPRDSSVALFVNFGPIAALDKLDHSPKDARVIRALDHLSYLIAGNRNGNFQLVLGVK
jgi:hypothetical protein